MRLCRIPSKVGIFFEERVDGIYAHRERLVTYAIFRVTPKHFNQ